MKCRNFTTPYKGNLSSSITFDPDLGDYLEKDQQKQLSTSFHLTMGRASGAFTSLLSVNFPKANFKGMCGGNSGRPHVFYTRPRLLTSSVTSPPKKALMGARNF